MRFLIQNFGCRAAQADGAALAEQLSRQGMAPAACAREADLVILNTCTVTAAADQDVRQAVRRAHLANPGARILVTGCYAQRAPEELVRLDGVTWVVGNTHKHRIHEIIREPAGVPYHGQIFVGDIFAETEFVTAPFEEAAGDRTRPNLKVQDGCNNRCSFCIIPFVRGRSRSAPPDAVVEQVRRLSERHREIVLSGINLGRWGRDLGGRLRLVDLLRRLLEETPVQRIRLSSVEPMDLSGDLLDLMASSQRIAKHVHAPLQTGSDRILRLMRRRYRPQHYASRILEARRRMPLAAIGADVMVGFPGETDEDFQENRRFIESLPFTYLHVFTYSARPGTPAAAMPRQVPLPVRKERNRVLRELAAQKNLAFRRQVIGRTLSAVTLGDGRLALTDNYLEVELARPRPAGELIEVLVGGLTPDGLREATPGELSGSSGRHQPEAPHR